MVARGAGRVVRRSHDALVGRTRLGQWAAEKLGKTGAQGETMVEGCNINASLSALAASDDGTTGIPQPGERETTDVLTTTEVAPPANAPSIAALTSSRCAGHSASVANR